MTQLQKFLDAVADKEFTEEKSRINDDILVEVFADERVETYAYESLLFIFRDGRLIEIE